MVTLRLITENIVRIGTASDCYELMESKLRSFVTDLRTTVDIPRRIFCITRLCLLIVSRSGIDSTPVEPFSDSTVMTVELLTYLPQAQLLITIERA